MDIQRPCFLALGVVWERIIKIEAFASWCASSWEKPPWWFRPCHSGGANRADSHQSTSHWCVLRPQGFQCFDPKHAIDWGPWWCNGAGFVKEKWPISQVLAQNTSTCWQVLEEMVVRISAFHATEAEVVYGIAKLRAWSFRFAVWHQHATRLLAESAGGRVLSR